MPIGTNYVWDINRGEYCSPEDVFIICYSKCQIQNEEFFKPIK